MNLHPDIAATTIPVCVTSSAQVLLMNDKRWPWFILVPGLAGINELHDFSDEQRNDFMSDVNRVSKCLQAGTQCRSVNVAMLGNVVSQLHCHVVARNEGDLNWPGPVWGFGTAVAYGDQQPLQLMNSIKHSVERSA